MWEFYLKLKRIGIIITHKFMIWSLIFYTTDNWCNMTQGPEERASPPVFIVLVKTKVFSKLLSSWILYSGVTDLKLPILKSYVSKATLSGERQSFILTFFFIILLFFLNILFRWGRGEGGGSFEKSPWTQNIQF